LKPVDEMTAAAEAVSVTDLAARLRVAQTNDELQRLGEAWNRMLERIAPTTDAGAGDPVLATDNPPG
jgi:nitrate/nitrite-specific signal transduction histidine kinase